MKRCIIVGGAPINNYERVKKYIRDDDFIVYCDCGLKHMEGLGRKPDLIVADFDSSSNPNMDCETIILPHVKDDTDTGHAAVVASHRGYEKIIFIGTVGKRFDHSMANVSLMFKLHKAGIKTITVDDYSEMEVVSENKGFVSDEFEYFSLINIMGTAWGVTIKNALYEIEDAEVETTFANGNIYTVSNEPVKGKTAEISVKKGALLLVKDFKE